ncbi:MAG: hypothetical protein KGI19_10685, partial [Thaumarchaeota archaeon]|nr:hypothetical protein [Nitrososphaerota archaeon]
KVATVRRKKVSRKPSKKLKTVDDWYALTDQIVKTWNTQPNPPKVYVGGYRVHHGTVGAFSTGVGIALAIGASLTNDKTINSLARNASPALIGIGTKLMIDDLHDFPDWFNFERQPQFQTACVQPLHFHPTTMLPVGQPTEFV